jgi:transcriptional regulator with XRE-family HTH domain
MAKYSIFLPYFDRGDDMGINKLMADGVILAALGKRLARHRIAQNYTQEVLATEAGISKRTLERLEAGQPSQLLTLIRVLRALNMMNLLEAAIPETMTRPVDLLKLGKDRQRASTKKEQQNKEWFWGDE